MTRPSGTRYLLIEGDAMTTLMLGSALFLAGAGLFWQALPRHGGVRWFVGTQWEPYVAVAITSVAGLGFTFVLSGLVAVFG